MKQRRPTFAVIMAIGKVTDKAMKNRFLTEFIFPIIMTLTISTIAFHTILFFLTTFSITLGYIAAMIVIPFFGALAFEFAFDAICYVADVDDDDEIDFSEK